MCGSPDAVQLPSVLDNSKEWWGLQSNNMGERDLPTPNPVSHVEHNRQQSLIPPWTDLTRGHMIRVPLSSGPVQWLEFNSFPGWEISIRKFQPRSDGCKDHPDGDLAARSPCGDRKGLKQGLGKSLFWIYTYRTLSARAANVPHKQLPHKLRPRRAEAPTRFPPPHPLRPTRL